MAAFEPDLDNFAKLRNYVIAAGTSLGDTFLFPCGLGDRTEHRRFDMGRGGASSMSDAGASLVQVVALDDVLPTFAATFIKLDVEGAEPAALRGARRTLERHCPDVAVSVYHAASHLWEVPLLLHELQPQYSFMLRYHQFNGFDVVAYAFKR